MQRLHPPPTREVSILEAYATPRPPGPNGRPWLALCMIASMDGSTVLRGASGALSNDTDREVLLTLRTQAEIKELEQAVHDHPERRDGRILARQHLERGYG